MYACSCLSSKLNEEAVCVDITKRKIYSKIDFAMALSISLNLIWQKSFDHGDSLPQVARNTLLSTRIFQQKRQYVVTVRSEKV